MKRDCPDNKEKENEDDAKKTKKYDKDGNVISTITVDSGSEDGMCMAVTKEEDATIAMAERGLFVMLDGGADEHCCRQDFVPSTVRVNPTSIRLRDVGFKSP